MGQGRIIFQLMAPDSEEVQTALVGIDPFSAQRQIEALHEQAMASGQLVLINGGLIPEPEPEEPEYGDEPTDDEPDNE